LRRRAERPLPCRLGGRRGAELLTDTSHFITEKKSRNVINTVSLPPGGGGAVRFNTDVEVSSRRGLTLL